MTKPQPPDRKLKRPLEVLAAADPDFARAYALCGLPPKRRQSPGFPGLIRIITAQQVSAASARAIIGRLEQALPDFSPRAFLELGEPELREIGFSRQKTAYARGIAANVLEGQLDFAALHRQPDEEAIKTLIACKGIGRWTAEIYLLFALERPDVWPAGDLAVQLAAQRLKGLRKRPDEKRLRRLAEAWRPHRSAAARFLWHFYRHPGVPD